MNDIVDEMCSRYVRDAGVEQMQVAQVHPVGKGAQALTGGRVEDTRDRCKRIGEGTGQ